MSVTGPSWPSCFIPGSSSEEVKITDMTMYKKKKTFFLYSFHNKYVKKIYFQHKSNCLWKSFPSQNVWFGQIFLGPEGDENLIIHLLWTCRKSKFYQAVSPMKPWSNSWSVCIPGTCVPHMYLSSVLTLVMLNKDATPTSNFQPIRLLDPGCWYKLTYFVTNSVGPDQLASGVDPDQLASEEANWSGSTQ